MVKVSTGGCLAIFDRVALRLGFFLRPYLRCEGDLEGWRDFEDSLVVRRGVSCAGC